MTDCRNENLKKEIDLHFQSVERSLSLLEMYFEWARSQKILCVGIITGAGRHSHNGSCLKPAVKNWLSKRNDLSFTFDGVGKFVVMLK